MLEYCVAHYKKPPAYFLGMTVGNVYWHFDTLAAYIKLTSPFGGGDESSDSPAIPGRVEQNTHAGGFEFAHAAVKADPRFGKNLQKFNSIDDVRTKDAHTADFLNDIKNRI